MNPILGPAGAAALYKRSLLLAGRSHPWLAGLYGEGPSAADVEALTAALARQEPGEAALGAGAHLESFYALLSSLVGPSLTRSLLHFMWQPFEESASRKSP